jgi:type II secretory pathway pseudopilin PulG
MMLFITLMLIAAAAAAPQIEFQIRREREEELIHRGVEYTRAIRMFTKRTGRFPNRLEELENTNGLRFIRKLYKDPVTGGDFLLLHLADIRPSSGVPNLNPRRVKADISGTTDSGAEAASTDSGDPQASTGEQGLSQPHGDTPAQSGSRQNNGQNSAPQVIFGVASSSKLRSIREFNHKDHYNQWLFFYDPALDRGYPIKGPSTPFVPTAPSPQPSTAQANRTQNDATQSE